MSARIRPSRPPSKLAPAILLALIACALFSTLMVRLEATREGYRLSALRSEITRLANENRTLRVSEAQLSSQDRLRALAPRYDLAPPAPGQVVMLP
ncbi:MAG: hypothetical protein ACREQI_17080 [Candidatus Binataceae bacterium]